VFAYGNARRYYGAVFLSFTALAIQMLARGWIIQRDTGAPLLVALVPVMMMGPSLFLSLFGGVLADRVSRKRIMLAAEAANLAGFGVLAALVVADVAVTWHILAVTMFNGVTTAFSMPSRQAMVAGIVRRHEVPVAIGVQAVTFNLSQIIGPGVAGVLITQAGVGVALVASAVMIVPVLFLYAQMRPQRRELELRMRPRGPVLRNLGQGLRYVATDPFMRWLLALGSVVTVTLAAWQAVLPTVADEVLHGGAGLLGTLTLAGGVGGLIGAFAVAGLGNRVRFVRIEMAGALGWAVAIAVFAVSPVVAASVAIAVVAGITRELFFAANFGASQVATRDEFRGRVMSARGVMFGLQPIGALALGAVAEFAGVRPGLILLATSGAASVLVVHLLLYRRSSEPSVPSPEARPSP